MDASVTVAMCWVSMVMLVSSLVGKTSPLGDVELAVVSDVNVGRAVGLAERREHVAEILAQIGAAVAVPVASSVPISGEPEIVAELLGRPARAPVDVFDIEQVEPVLDRLVDRGVSLVGEVVQLVQAIQLVALVVARRPQGALHVAEHDALKQSLSGHGGSSLVGKTSR